MGAYLGGLTSTYSWSDAFAGISEFHHLVVVSILFIGIGLFALPATLLFIIMFTRSEWPLWTVTVATLLIWWNTHKTIYWTLHESAAAQIQKIADDANQQLAKEVEEERKKNQAEAAK